jgi:hypothetical protein
MHDVMVRCERDGRVNCVIYLHGDDPSFSMTFAKGRAFIDFYESFKREHARAMKEYVAALDLKEKMAQITKASGSTYTGKYND